MDGLWVVDTRALTTREKCRKCVVINKTCVNAHDDSIDFSTKQLILYTVYLLFHINSLEQLYRFISYGDPSYWKFGH